MLIVTTDHITGKNVEMLGLVKGSTIQTVHMGKDIMNGFKTLVGGELTSYNEMMNEARAPGNHTHGGGSPVHGSRCHCMRTLLICLCCPGRS